MFRIYDLVVRKDGFVVSEKEVTPVFIRSLENRSFNDVFDEFKKFLAERGEKFFCAWLKRKTDIHLSFWFKTIKTNIN